MDNKELTPIQKLMLSIETTPEICFPIEINFNDGQEILEALQSQNTYNPETHVVIPKKFNDRQLKRIADELDQSGININYPAQIRIIKSVILKVSADKAITSKGE